MAVTVGASEVAVILGLGRLRQDGTPYTSQLELWSRLVGLMERYDSSSGPEAEVGRWFEYGILARLVHERGWAWGRDVWPGPTLEQPGLQSAGIPWHARPDAVSTWGPVEAKAPRCLYPDEWGDTPDAIPPYYAAQVLAQLAVEHALRGVEVGILAAMARAPGWGAPRVWATYELRRSPRRERAMVSAVSSWLERHVERHMPPQPDGSESATYALRRMWQPVDGEVRTATPTDLEHYHRMLRSRDAADELLGRMRESQQQLQQSMGSATRLVAPNGQTLATWRADKRGTRRWHTASHNTQEAA